MSRQTEYLHNNSLNSYIIYKEQVRDFLENIFVF